MKKSACFILVLILLTAFACKPIVRYCCDVAQRWAEIDALKNGVAWSPQYVNGVLTDIDSLKIAAMSGTATGTNFVKTDTLIIKIFYTGTGTYKLTNNRVFYATFANGAITRYNIDTTYNNVLNITSYQKLENPATPTPDPVEMKGTFDIKLIDPNSPAGISISNATFYAIMQR
jgi:hypothetical protein